MDASNFDKGVSIWSRVIYALSRLGKNLTLHSKLLLFLLPTTIVSVIAGIYAFSVTIVLAQAGEPESRHFRIPINHGATIKLSATETLRYHDLVVDSQDKILPWYLPADHAYDQYLRTLWAWLPTVPNGPSSSLPMYYLYCGFHPGTPITPNTWENDWGERLPNFVEFGRLYYAYSGDMAALNIARNLMDYALANGISPANYNWPNFPYGTADAGSTTINGKNPAWPLHSVLVDLGSDIGLSFYQLYLIFGDERYRTAAINTADTLVSKIQPGNATDSPWPYVVDAEDGTTISRYTSNFAGSLRLFDLLIEHGEPNSAAYSAARQTLKNWLLQYPMQNGNWVDGHSDVQIYDNTNWSNTSKSNMNLYLLDNPSFDPNFNTDVPKLLKWTEDNFINVHTTDQLPGQYHGAYIPAEQKAWMYRMGYQASRQAAEYAGWYVVSGDETYKDRAYRGFNYSTYMMKSSGESSDGPTDDTGFWWSDIYGEGPRMFFYGFMAVPEWAPPGENHILYSNTILKDIIYAAENVQYTSTDEAGTEYLRLAFLPGVVTANGVILSLRTDLNAEGYTVRNLGGGDFSVIIKRARSGIVSVSASSGDTPTPTATYTPAPTITPTSTNTPTPTDTNTPTPPPTATYTPTPTITPTSTNTPTPTDTVTPTPTPTATDTPTPTITPTSTNTPTPTDTVTPTATDTPTPTVYYANLAVNRPATVSSFQDDSHFGAMAVDNNLTTYWQSKKVTGKTGSPSEWIVVDLGSSATINQLVLEWSTNYAVNYSISLSDDNVSWRIIFTTTTGNGGSDTISISPSNARYVKMQSIAWNSSSFRCWLKEVEVYGSYNSPPSTSTPTPTVNNTTGMHVGDLDGATNLNRNKWDATVTIAVHDPNEIPVAGVTVSGYWEGVTTGNASCITAATGKCSVTVTGLRNTGSNAIFNVSNLLNNYYVYLSNANHDPDGDSNGTRIVVYHP